MIPSFSGFLHDSLDQLNACAPSDPDAPRVIRVIVSGHVRGKGTNEDPLRVVKRYHSLDGEFLAENDPVAGKKS